MATVVVVGIAFLLLSYTRASSENDKAEVMALDQRLVAAYDTGDVQAVMACYSDDSDAIFFEDTIPFQLNKAALRKLNEMAYQSVSDFHARQEAVDILISGNLAVVRSSILNTWTDKSGTPHSRTSRYTQVDRKENGRWLVWHEHFSVPYSGCDCEGSLPDHYVLCIQRCYCRGKLHPLPDERRPIQRRRR